MASWLMVPSVLLGPAQPETVAVPPLYGISSVTVGSEGIEVTKDESLPSGLDLRKGGEALTRATVRVGESFAVTDGHHLGYTFKLLAVERAEATVETLFWTSFPGAAPTSSTSTTRVRSYVVGRKKVVK